MMKKTLLLSLFVLFVSTIMAQTPIAHWPLNGNTNDIIGSKNATAEGGISWVTDATRGQCAQFNGVDGIIVLPYPIWESETDTNTTISCWFNWAGGAAWQRVYSLGMTTGAWELMYYSPSDGNGLHHLTFKTVTPVDQWTDIIGSTFGEDYDTLSTNTWYFSTIVMEENNLRVYMNGTKVADMLVQITPQAMQPAVSKNVLGESHWADPTFNGMIDDFRIYGEALSDAQILELYNEVVVGINDTKINSVEFNFYGSNGKILYKDIDESMVSNVAVYTITGSQLFQSNALSDLNAQHFSHGIYLVTVTYGNENFTTKVGL